MNLRPYDPVGVLMILIMAGSILLVPDIGQAQDSVTQFNGADPGAAVSSPRPNSERVAASFDEMVRALGPVHIVTFEDLPEGPFDSLRLGPGVTASTTGTTAEGGIVRGCFTDCGTDLRRGYNVTPGGSQYLGMALVFEVGTVTLDFSFDDPIQAFGTYIIGLGSANGDLMVEFADETAQSISVEGNPRGGAQFFGFAVPGGSINSVRLILRNVMGGSRDNYSVDDVRYVQTG